MPVTQADIDNAVKKKDNAQSSLNSAKSSLDSWYALITRCCYKDGTLIYGEASDVKCQKCYTGCNKEHSGCCEKGTCEGNMASYNQSVDTYTTSQDNLSKAEDDLSKLQDDLATQEGNNFDAAQNAEDRKSSQSKIKYIIFAVIILGLLAGGTLVALKTLNN